MWKQDEVLQIQGLKNIIFYIIILTRFLEKMLHQYEEMQELAPEHGI